MCLPALPAPAAEAVSASLEDMVRHGKTHDCVDGATRESVARFGGGARLVAVVVGGVDERRRRAPTTSAVWFCRQTTLFVASIGMQAF